MIQRMAAGAGTATALATNTATSCQNRPMWSPGQMGSAAKNAFKHWKEKGVQFPELQNAKQYVDAAHSFVNNPPAGTLQHVTQKSHTMYYHEASNTFVSTNPAGAPETMFKPGDGIQYWYRSLQRYP